MTTRPSLLGALLAALAAACGSEDSEFHDWTIRHADAVCNCVDAADPRKCVEEMPDELSMTGDHAQSQLVRWKGKGGPKAQGNLVRAIDCHRAIQAWGVEHPLPSSTARGSVSASPSAAPSASAGASAAPSASAGPSAAPSASAAPSVAQSASAARMPP
jgi:hypothetical protein